jgi:hypothetical protein
LAEKRGTIEAISGGLRDRFSQDLIEPNRCSTPESINGKDRCIAVLATVAPANKMAGIAWGGLAKGANYQLVCDVLREPKR